MAEASKKKFTQYLKCEFSDPEIADKAKDLAAANRKRSAIEQQKKEIDSDLKAKIEEQNSAIQRLSEQIAQGFEYREVECRIEFDSPTMGQKSIIRLDTGESREGRIHDRRGQATRSRFAVQVR